MFPGVASRFLFVLAPLSFAPAARTPCEEPRPALLDPAAFDRSAAAHLLWRTGFGPTPDEIERFAALGLDKAVETLLDVSAADSLPAFEPHLTERPARRDLAALSKEDRQKKVREIRRDDGLQFQRLRAWWLRRMVMTSRPLEEKLTLFWHGHFATSQQDVKNSYHMYLQNQLLRKHALGNFKELVRAVAKDPAMLEYLDNNRNNRRAPNENFARELLELFTLGVGNYTEQDIKEAARALTGWTFEGNEFRFQTRTHDPGQKTFLGRTGKLTGDDVIDVIFEQPAVSTFVVRKLFVFFAHDEPPADVLEALAAAFRKNRFELKPVLSLLFKCSEFYSPRARASQYKSPVQLVAGTLRLLKIDPGDSPAFALMAGRMGQDLFLPPNVKGWDGGKSWISTQSLLDRYNFSSLLLGIAEPRESRERGKKAASQRRLMGLGGKFPRWQAQAGAGDLLGGAPRELSATDTVDRLARRFLVVPLPEEGRTKLTRFYDGGSGTASDRPARLQELLHLLLSTPEYQLN